MFMNPEDMQEYSDSDDEGSEGEGEDSGDENHEQAASDDEGSDDQGEAAGSDQEAAGDKGEAAGSDQEASGDEDEAAGDEGTSTAQVGRGRRNKKGGNDTPSGPVAPSDPSGSGDSTSGDSTVGIDWRTQGVVNAVKNQGQCGSCWSFASNAQMESLYAIKTGTLYSLSEQQLVDCSTKGNNGCNGGFMTNVFNYYSNKKYMMQSSDYPYKGRQKTCKYDSSNATPV